MNKKVGFKALKFGERLMFDISSIRHVSIGGSKFWLKIIDEYSNFKWSFFLKKKSELGKVMCSFIKKQKNNYEVSIETLRCDNAGENVKFKKLAEEEGLGVQFEFTAPYTPQQNGSVERSFATSFGRIRAMMNFAGLNGDLRYSLWAECANVETDICNISVSKNGDKSPYEKSMFKKSPKFIDNLRVFGEVGVLFNKKKIRGKMENRGESCIFVGYPKDHGSEVFRVYKLKTKSVVVSRNVRWMNIMYGDYIKKKNTKISESFFLDLNNGIEDEDDLTAGRESSRSDDVEKEQKVLRELRKLNTSYNPTLSAMITTDVAFVGGGNDDYDNPVNFKDAWDHPVEKDKEKWRAAIRKEFQDMIKNKVWKKYRKENVPSNRRIIGHKWVFKVKGNGVFRARLCAIGYSQVAGVDFTDNFAPVINDVTFRILMVLKLIKNWVSDIIDVETAFLNGNLDEEIYMSLPEGLSFIEDFEDLNDEEDCVLLVKSLYGLVQAARQFYKKLVEVLVNELSFEKCLAEPCLLMKKSDLGIVIFCLYVDDILCIGNREAVNDAKFEIKKFFKITDEGDMKEYVGCSVQHFERKLIMHQPELIKKIRKNFFDDVKNLRRYRTGGAPGEIIMKSNDSELKLDDITLTKYRSGVGMLMYLVKFSRPDLSNCVRELSKVMRDATESHLKDLFRTIKFVLDTSKWGLKYELKENSSKKWELKAFCDSDFAGDKEKRISVTGFCIFYNDCLISWKSRGQKSVSLSSTEAEYVAMSEVSMEVIFIKHVLVFLGIELEFPIVIHCDNVGAIYLANNAKTSGRTKHIDTRYHYVREFIEDGIVKIIFVRSEDNQADPFTKNVPEVNYTKNSDIYLDKG